MRYFFKNSIITFFACLIFSSSLFAVPKSPPPLIEVSVDAIEIKSSKENSTGLTWTDAIQFTEQNPALVPSVFSIGTIKRQTAIGSTLRALIKNNQARILANPKLATESGSQASFLVGGEIPIPVVSPQGVSIEWKTYGIELQIKPQVLGKNNKKISAMIQVSVSDLDFANSVKLQGFDVPALLNRKASSKVSVDDGGTVVIAGLKQTRKEKTEQRTPEESLL